MAAARRSRPRSCRFTHISPWCWRPGSSCRRRSSNGSSTSPGCQGDRLSESPLSLPDYLAFLGNGFAVEGHRPWPRFVLDEEGWRALATRLESADWSLLGLWGESDAVHVALHDEADGALALASVGCAAGRFPALSAVRPGAIRLERTIFDLFGHVPIGSLGGRPWLDHRNWPVVHPLAARPSERALPPGYHAGTSYPFLAAQSPELHQIALG